MGLQANKAQPTKRTESLKFQREGKKLKEKKGRGKGNYK